MDFLRRWADVNGRVGVGTLDYRVCFTSGARLCELHQAADGLLHNDRGGMGTLDYRRGVGTLDYRVCFLQVPDYASYIKQPMDFLRRWADVNGRVGVGTLDYRQG